MFQPKVGRSALARPRRSRFNGILAALIAVSGGLTAPARAAEPVVAGEVAVAPADRLEAVLKKAGAPAGAGHFAADLAEKLPFLGAGSVDPSKPIQMLFFAGDALRDQEQAMFILPVKPDAATLAGFVKHGWQQPAGKPDVVVAPNGFALRRTDAYLYVGASTDMVAKPDEAALAKAFAEPGVLARGWADIKAMRQASPNKIKAFLDTIEQREAGHNPGQLAGAKLVTDLIREKLDTFELVLAAGAAADTISISATASPVSLKAADAPGAAKFQRPTFPGGRIAELHVAYPAADAIATFGPALEAAWRLGGGADAPGADAAAIRAMLDAGLDLLVGDAVSVALEDVNGQLVTYAVIQRTRERNLDAELGRLEQAAARVEKGSMARSTYQDGALSVSRLTLNDKGKPVAHADFVQQGKALLLAVSTTDAKHVARLAAGLKFDGELSRLASAEVDMAKLRPALEARGVMPKDAAGPQTGRVTLDATVEGRSLTVRWAVPLTYLGEMMKQFPGQ